MTCIVGAINKETNKIYIGGDSAGSTAVSITICNDICDKIFTKRLEIVDGEIEMVYGVSGCYRLMQLLRYNFIEPKYHSDIFGVNDYLINSYIPAVKELLKDEEVDLGNFLIAFKLLDKPYLFNVQPGFSIIQDEKGLISIGSGADFAISALYTMNLYNIPIDEKAIENSLKISTINPQVREPFIIKEID